MGSRSFLTLQGFTFLGALLLFTLEPLVGRLLLPLHGGSFHVWTTCLMLFQLLLLLGYFYCHYLAKRIGRGHLIFALIPLLLFPLQMRGSPDANAPILSLAISVVLSVAAPFLVLSSTSVMAQTWLSQSNAPERKHPYQLYAASNLGALLGLVLYPTIIEPFLNLRTQKWMWSAGYILYVGLTWVASKQAINKHQTEIPQDSEGEASLGKEAEESPVELEVKPQKSPSYLLKGYWFLLSALPSMLLVAVTNVITNDVGSFPFLWVAPLILYTLTFVFIFRPKPIFDSAKLRFLPEILAAVAILSMGGHVYLRWQETPTHLFVFFAMTLAGHRELYRVRPGESGLTGFYLILAVGGAAGGVFVTLVAPAIFTQLHEYALSIALLSVVLLIGRIAWAKIYEKQSLRIVKVLASVTCLLCLSVSWMTAFPDKPDGKKIIYTYRNYYGLHRVFDEPIGGINKGTLRNYAHGTTIHGAQVLGDKWPKPLAYYHPENRLGEYLLQRGPEASNIAVVGLGAGSLASYTRTNDKMTFYELDPDNEKIARDYFDFLGNAKGEVSVTAGDARLTIQRDVSDGSLDILIVDAFSSDVVPVHLLTVEALKLYRSKLKANGLLFFHVSNRIYDFKPVLFHTAKELNVHLMDGQVDPKKTKSDFLFPAKWMLLLGEDQDRKPFRKLGWASVNSVTVEVDPWTDDYASILVLLWNHWKKRLK